MRFNLKIIIRMMGAVSVIIGGAMTPALLVSLALGERHLTSVFGAIIVPLVIIGLPIFLFVRNAQGNIRVRDGLLLVAISWLFVCLLGALPYVVSGVMPSYADAFFESVSGFTTTGVTLIDDLSKIPRSLLFWRSLSNWIGGIGILIFAILPALGVGSVNIINAEGGGNALERIRARMSDNAKHIYLIYVALTAIEFFLLLASRKMDAFEAFIHSFGSMGNAGLSTTGCSIMEFQSIYVEAVIAVFCILASMNFLSFKLLFQKRIRDFFREAEIRIFLMILISTITLIVLTLWAKGTYGTIGESIRQGFFQTVAFVTTSGYTVADYSIWPVFCKCLLFAVIFIGGCSASTSGGMKIVRFAVIVSLIRRNIYKRLHPNAVVAIKLGDNAISSDKVSNITVFVLVYFFLFGLSAILMSLDGQSAGTTASAAISALSNAGLGFGDVSYGMSYQVFSTGGRLLLSAIMLIGRLELYTIILLFTPNFWRPDHR